MAKTEEITNNQDTIDSRDIIERIEELEEREADITDEATEEELKELADLRALAEEADSREWESGVFLIRDSYFEEYCEELCEDVGDLPRDFPSYIVIDWDATASNIRQDYSEVDFDGVSYLYR